MLQVKPQSCVQDSQEYGLRNNMYWYRVTAANDVTRIEGKVLDGSLLDSEVTILNFLKTLSEMRSDLSSYLEKKLEENLQQVT